LILYFLLDRDYNYIDVDGYVDDMSIYFMKHLY